MTDGELLRRAAERASHRRFYLASSLLAYARAERLDDAGLAARLGCDTASLPALLLCRRPTGEGPVFRADVEAIAERFRLDSARLALVSLGGAATDQTGGLLAAARDREDGDRQRDDESADSPPPESEPNEGNT